MPTGIQDHNIRESNQGCWKDVCDKHGDIKTTTADPDSTRKNIVEQVIKEGNINAARIR